MPIPPDPPRQNTRTRRRYMQGSTRSRTIELGTLSEVDEDIYHNREGYEEPDGKASTVECNGTIRRPTNGTVRSIARHLSERQKIERARSVGSVASPAAHPGRNEEHMHPGVSHEEVVTSVNFRQVPCIHFGHRTVRCISEHTDLRGPLAKWSPPPPLPPPPLMHHHLDDKCNSTPHASMSEFHPRTVSTMSRGHGTRSISRSSSMAGGLLVYDPRTMSLMDPRLAAEMQMPDYTLPV
ncbi:unnamed protein product [Cylicocyclus nassatus]|uniref:Uncharacterized protein n=1 Tax=Cylicocyclus nassatus TaxID=53992 RepID=A0AA36H631_CYLNA|nr:unnamed protein product [Cylicocyclus nassatus]